MYTYPEYSNVRRFAGLDGLRALSIVLVMLCHMPRMHSRWLLNVQENGSSGVSLFFVISGFLITTLFLREPATPRPLRGLLQFFGRRAIRLWPAYYAALIAVFLVTTHTHLFSADSATLMRDRVLVYASYQSNWLPDKNGPFFFSWSLAAEEQFYISFGLLAYAFGRRALNWLAPAFLLVALGVHLAVDPNAVMPVSVRVLSSIQEPILCGVIVALLLHSPVWYGRVARVASNPLLLCACVGVWLNWLVVPENSAFHGLLEHGVYAAMTILVAAVVVHAPTHVLDAAPVALVGQISYGMYLLHWFVIVALAHAMPQGTSLLLYFTVCVAAVCGAAWLMSHFYEQPIIAHLKPLLQERPRRPEAVAAVTPTCAVTPPVPF